jgi:hypothetical protein
MRPHDWQYVSGIVREPEQAHSCHSTHMGAALRDPHAWVDFALTLAPQDHTSQLEAKRDNDYVRARANAYMARRFRALRAGKSALIVGHL